MSLTSCDPALPHASITYQGSKLITAAWPGIVTMFSRESSSLIEERGDDSVLVLMQTETGASSKLYLLYTGICSAPA